MAALVIGAIGAFIVFDPLLGLLLAPFQKMASITSEKPLYITSIFEGFILKMKLCALFGLFFSFPVHLFNGIQFVFPGLTVKERKIMSMVLVSSFLLSLFGFYIVYFNLLPLSVMFLTSRQFIPSAIGLLLHYDQNIFYIVRFIFYVILVFQFPIVLELLLYLNVFSRKTLMKSGRFMIVLLFIIAAVITPPDAISQLMIALPMIGLFYLTVLIAKLFKFGEG